ncbi:hypothetical protein K3G63_06630 [Hymenobacter sp. HSC-4F20]|nr:hypothetical protein [Hymenobacter sp. HSC-4F20]
MNKKVGFGTLVNAITKALPGANDSKTLYKSARLYDRNVPGGNATDETLLDLNPDFLALGAICYVEFPQPSREYRLVYSETGPLSVWIDGSFSDVKVLAKWVERNSLEEKNAGIQDFIPFASKYADGEVVKFYLSGTLRLFAAKQELVKSNFPDNLIPEPTGLSTDTHWEEVNGVSLTTLRTWLKGAYKVDEVVVFNGQLFRAKRAFASTIAPAAGTDWELLTSGGAGVAYDDSELRTRIDQVEQDAADLLDNIETAKSDLNARIDALVTAATPWQAGNYVQGEFVTNGGNVFVAKQDIANSTVAPTATNVYWLQVNGTGSGSGTSYDDTELRSLINQKVDKVTGKGLSTNDYTNPEKTKLAGLQNYDDTALKNRVTAVEAGKVDKVTGKGLSSEDYTSAEKAKLAGLQNYTLQPDSVAENILAPDVRSKLNAVSSGGVSYDDTALVARVSEVESDLVDAENAILDLETEIERRVLKVVGKQLTDQNYTLEEKQKLAGLSNNPSLFKGAYDATKEYAQGEFVVERNSLYMSLSDGNIGYDVDFPDGDGTKWWQAVIKQNSDEIGVAYALLYPDGQNIVLETDKAVYSVPIPASYDDTSLTSRVVDVELGKVDKVPGKGLSTEDFTSAEKTKLAGLQNATSYDDSILKGRVTNVETRVASVENMLPAKVDKVSGKQLSTEDFTTAEKTKLAGLQNAAAYDDTALKGRVSSVETSVATKVDRVSGKQLSTEDFTSAEKTKLASLIQGLTEETLPQAFVNIQDSASQLFPVVNGNGKLLLYLTNDVVKSWHIANGHVALDKLSPQVLELLQKPTGDTIAGVSLNGTTLTISTDRGTMAVDLSSLAGNGSGSGSVAPALVEFMGTLDSTFSGVLPFGTQRIFSLHTDHGYSLHPLDYIADYQASPPSFTITNTAELVIGDRYWGWVLMTGTAQDEVPENYYRIGDTWEDNTPNAWVYPGTDWVIFSGSDYNGGGCHYLNPGIAGEAYLNQPVRGNALRISNGSNTAPRNTLFYIRTWTSSSTGQWTLAGSAVNMGESTIPLPSASTYYEVKAANNANTPTEYTVIDKITVI